MVVITKLLVWFYLILFDSESFSLRSFENENFELVFMVLPGLNTWIIWNTKIASKSFPASEMTKLRKCSTRQKNLGKSNRRKKVYTLEWRHEPNEIEPIGTVCELKVTSARTQPWDRKFLVRSALWLVKTWLFNAELVSFWWPR